MKSRRGFEPFDHTADLGARVFAPTLEELFAGAAEALFALMVDVEAVAPADTERIEVALAPEEEDDEALLLREWLAELLYRFEVKGRVYRDFRVLEVSRRRAVALARGEAFEPARHPVLRPIKAVTYHGLAIAHTPEGLEAQIIFDV